MNRTALRLSTVAALSGGGAAPFPTMANQYVYDSRQDDIVDLSPEIRRPVIVVRTDDDERTYLTPQGAPSRAMSRRSINLKVEISVIAAAIEQDGTPVVGWPETDSELEAMLDLMEYQVEAALRGSTVWAMWWQHLWSLEDWSSLPFFDVSDEGNARLAAREIRVRIRAKGECLPPPVRIGEPVPEAELPADLVAVFDRIERDGAGDIKAAAAAIRAKLEARYLPASGVHPPLQSVFMTVPEPGSDEPQVEAELLEE